MNSMPPVSAVSSNRRIYPSSTNFFSLLLAFGTDISNAFATKAVVTFYSSRINSKISKFALVSLGPKI